MSPKNLCLCFWRKNRSCGRFQPYCYPEVINEESRWETQRQVLRCHQMSSFFYCPVIVITLGEVFIFFLYPNWPWHALPALASKTFILLTATNTQSKTNINSKAPLFDQFFFEIKSSFFQKLLAYEDKILYVMRA